MEKQQRVSLSFGVQGQDVIRLSVKADGRFWSV
jgi:hypothetical protein